MGHPIRHELTLVSLLIKLANHYSTRGALNDGNNVKKSVLELKTCSIKCCYYSSCIYLPNSFTQIGCNLALISQQSITCLNSVFLLLDRLPIPKLKSPVSPHFLPKAGENNLMHTQGYYHYVKCKQPCPGFDLGMLCTFQYSFNILLSVIVSVEINKRHYF